MYHPGQPLFHEGSKGWTCCSKKVLEFDEFMKIEGCKQKSKHLFVGSGKHQKREEAVKQIRCVNYRYISGLKIRDIDCFRADTITIKPPRM